MPDVTQKIISANDYNNGGALVGTDKFGNTHVIQAEVNRVDDLTALYEYKMDGVGKELSAIVAVDINNSGIVTAVPGRSIEVLTYVVVASGQTTFKFVSDGTNLTGTMHLASNGGVSYDGEGTSFAGVRSGGLQAAVGAGAYVGGHITYRLI